MNTTQRLWVLAPPLIEHHTGLPNAMQLVRRMASASGARPLLAATDKTRNAIEALPGHRPTGKEGHVPVLPTWTDVVQQFSQAVTDGDAILLLSARRGHLAWQPSLERLPLEWTRRWPNLNLMTLFPPVLSADSEAEESDDTDGPDTAPVQRPPNWLPVETASGEPAVAIREMLDVLLPDAGFLLNPLAMELQKSPAVPLSTTTALLHSHTPLVGTARVAVGRHASGFKLEGFAAAPEELVLLLSPKSGTPEAHLRILATLARAAHRGPLLPT